MVTFLLYSNTEAEEFAVSFTREIRMESQITVDIEITGVGCKK